MVDLNSLLGPFAPGGGGQSSPMSMPLLGSQAYQQQQGQRHQAASQLEIQQALELARALQQQSSPDNERITSPWQVVGKMAQALGGQLQIQKARELQGQQSEALAGLAYPGAGGSGGGEAAPGPSADLSYGAGIVPMDVAKAAIAANESGGNYGEVGPTTHGGNALGKYQVMSYDLPQRLADAGLPAMTAAEFLLNPQAQERQFEHEFGGLMQKHGNFNDAASVWFSGRPMAAAGNASDGYMTVPQYVGKANATIARLTGANGTPGADPTGAQASAFSPGGPGGNAPNGAMAIADALSGGRHPAGGPQSAAGAPAGAPGPGAPQARPNGQGDALHPGAIGMGPNGPIYTNPNLIQRRPFLTQDQFRTAMVMAGGNPQLQAKLMEMVQQQGQPIEVPTTWGSVRVHPQNPWIQEPKYTIEKWNEKLPGGIERGGFGLPSATGINRLPIVSPGAAPQPPGASPATSAPAPAPGAPQSPAGSAAGPSGVPAAAPAPAPAAANDPFPENGTTAEQIAWQQRNEVRQAAAKKAEEARAITAPDITAAEAKAAAEKKTAELGAELAPGVPERQTEIATAKKKGESQAEADVKQYSALHAGLAGAGMTASDQLDYIKVARGILNDPNFYSGIGENAVFNWNKVRSALGIDPTASLPQEAFRKIMAANILQQVNNLRAQQEAMGEKGGRIFASQIDMMEKAAQNPDNSVAGNKFLTEVAWRGAERARTIADMADDYKMEHGALDAGFEKQLRKWMGENSMFKGEELGNLRRIGQTPAQQTVPSTVAGSAPAPTPSTARKYNPVTGKIE